MTTKNVFLLLLIILCAISFSATANKLALSTCEYIAIDDKKRLRALMKDHRLKVKTLNKMVVCNNQTILEFADAKQAAEVGQLIIKKLPKKEVKKLLPAMKFEPLIAAAKDRIN